MSAVLETSDRHVDKVSVIVDPFWKAFVFETFLSGQFYRLRELPAEFTGGGNVRRSVCWRGVVGIRVGYSYPWHFSDQLPCRKYLDLRCCLFNTIF